MANAKVMIINAKNESLGILDSALQNEFVVHYLADENELISKLEQEKPDVILFDIDKNGGIDIEVCEELKSGFEFNDIPIIVLSSDTRFESRIKSYEAGVEDYIEKPLRCEEITTRIKAVLRYKNTVSELKEQANTAMQTVMSVITSSGEQAYVVDFLRESYRCKDAFSLGKALANSCESYELNVIIRLTSGDFTNYIGNVSEITPLEKSLFERLPKDVRIHTFKNRCIFHYTGVTILAKNMPIEDEDKCGRIRDNLAIMAEGANAALNSITKAKNIADKKQELQDLMEKSCDILDLINSKSRDQRVHSAAIMTSLIQRFEVSFMRLGLTEEQEIELLDLVKNAEQKQSILFNVGDALEKHLTNLIFGFEHALRGAPQP